MVRATDKVSQPVRQCAYSRRRAPQGCLIRLQLGPDGKPYVDVRGRGPGRGIYVSPETLHEALSPKGLRRVFRGKAQDLLPAEVDEMVAGTRERVTTRLEELIGLSRRTGEMALGADAVQAQLSRDRADVVVVVAVDAAERTRRRIEKAMASRPGRSVIRVSTRTRIGKALGRDAVSVVAIWHATLGPRILDEFARWQAIPIGASDVVPAASGIDESTGETRTNH